MKTKIPLVLIAVLILFRPTCSWADLEGLLFIPKLLSHDIEVTPAEQKMSLNMQKEPVKNSPVLATISRAEIKAPGGQIYVVPEFRSEETALPVLEHQGNWYKIGLLTASEPGMGFPEKFALQGWVYIENGEYQSIPDFLQNTMAELVEWDQTLYKSPDRPETFRVSFPSVRFLGTVRLKPENLKKTNVPCEIPFYADANKQKLIGICPQNFSFLHGAECEGPKDSSHIFCLQVYVLEDKNGLYKIAFKNDLVQFRKNQLDMKLLKQDPDFKFNTGWVDKGNFDNLKPLTESDRKTALRSIIGTDVIDHKGVEVLEHRKVQGQDWLRIKLMDHCADEKSYGEGWTPLRRNKKINFSYISRGC